MEIVSSARRLSRSVFANPLAFKLLLLAVAVAWALPSLAQDAAVGDNTSAAQSAPTGAGAAAADAEGVTWDGVQKALIVLAVIVVPMIVGNFLAKRLRMPEQGWRFSLALGSLLAAGVIIGMGEIKLGPDLSGGITLIYEVQGQEGAAQAADANDDQDAADPNAPANNNMASLIKALIERVDPAGTKEVSIKQFGEDQIEIIIPRAEKSELEAIERRIYTAGVLEFRITASRQFSKHANYIREAEKLPPGQNIVRIGGREVARWVAYDDRQFGDVDQAQRMGLVTRMSGDTPQALVITDDGLNVTGDYLRSAASDVDQFGGPAVSFVFNQQGAFKFRQLTSAHQPNPSGQKYSLGIMLDNRLLSAPSLNAVISDRGIIEGLDDQGEVEFLVGILNAGSLPASLNKTPISRAQISPTLGKTTVEKGQQSLVISLVLVALFMAFYYKKAGFISWLGLASNMLLILGCMVLIKAAFTLPGLAGLVLSIGMSVDANVLIYERIREELKRGAALRMAIRNGFNRATITILDSNITNLITAAVIYKIAPDSVKGFGVTLFLGIMMSVYTAVFLTRIVFDIAERRGWLRNMSMREFVGETHIDFLSWGKVAFAASLLFIAVGIYAVYDRGRDLLDIDFTGGSSVTMVLRDDQKMTFAEVEAALQQTELAEENLSLVEVGEGGARFTVTTINDDVEAVEGILAQTFAGKLATYQVEVENVQSIPAGGAAVGSRGSLHQLRRSLPLLPPLSYMTMLQETPADEAAPTDAAADQAGEQAANDAVPAESAAEAAEETPAATSDEPAEGEATPTGEEPTAADESAVQEEAVATQESAAETPQAADTAAPPAQFAGGTSARLVFSGGIEADQQAGVSHDTLLQMIRDALEAAGHSDIAVQVSNPEYQEGSTRTLPTWDVRMALPETAAREVLNSLATDINDNPVFPLSNKIGGRVAGRMAADAIAAIVLCLLGIIAYVWFRFHGVIYGVAAVAALIHDVLVALGFVALSSYVVDAAPPLAQALLIEKFQINLVLVAAFLTIIGYSLNDTIVIFDRIREVKGKSPRLTREIINLAVNQTLSRTILTAITTLMSVIVLYIFGGPGIHAFAFTLLVGFVAGLYSTIFIANPVLMWLANRFEGAEAAPAAKAA